MKAARHKLQPSRGRHLPVPTRTSSPFIKAKLNPLSEQSDFINWSNVWLFWFASILSFVGESKGFDKNQKCREFFPHDCLL